MISKIERQKDVIGLFEKLDISPTMYKNAIEKYKSITAYLEAHGIDADMYIQGSFALGTVVRPYSKDNNKGYDMDVVCKLRYSRSDITAQQARDEVRDILTSNDLYGGKMEEYDECFTIVYADINDVGFCIDIVPATDEDLNKKNELKNVAKIPELIDTAIAIPRGDVDWITNNPIGYRKWFGRINEPFKNYNQDVRRKVLFESAKQAYATIEEVPEELDRTSMQRVIQIMKHHRNVYYSNLKNGKNLKPISAILTTLIAHISAQAPSSYGAYELLELVLSELKTYGEYQTIFRESFEQKYPLKKIIYKDENDEWHIDNPANPQDNLADSWNDVEGMAKTFFSWLDIMAKDLVESLNLEDNQFGTILESAFGYDTVNRNLSMDKYKVKKAIEFTKEQQKSPWSK